MTRHDFMDFFRDEEKLNELSVEDRLEIFQFIMLGSGDFTKELLERILIDYSVPNLHVIDTETDKCLNVYKITP